MLNDVRWNFRVEWGNHGKMRFADIDKATKCDISQDSNIDVESSMQKNKISMTFRVNEKKKSSCVMGVACFGYINVTWQVFVYHH